MVEVRPLLRDAEPILREDLRPLVREATPLLADLRPSVRDLEPATVDLVRTGKVLNYVVNELGYNPPGAEEGYLFWTSWFIHNANSILTTEDAHGATWRGLVMVGCSTPRPGCSAPTRRSPRSPRPASAPTAAAVGPRARKDADAEAGADSSASSR